ncbi:MAG: hypothetical protein GY841_21655 [FCB group bacterium]|nr:hypothetical protein [FCB group bacterium]
MPRCFFVSDLHGRTSRYLKLRAQIAEEKPTAVFLGGDLLPPPQAISPEFGGEKDFINGFLAPEFEQLRLQLGSAYPRIFLILGNDDYRFAEPSILDHAARELWEYAHDRRIDFGSYSVYGYAYSPPSPLILKDWEKYDVSRFVDPGCVSPEEGRRTVPVAASLVKYGNIANDLKLLAGDDDLKQAIFLMHTPPYQTTLDRAALDGRTVDHVPLDVNIGSIAVRRFIETRQPLVTLHGHVHESARLTGAWQDRIRQTICFSAAHDGEELALIRFDPDCPEKAIRELV